MQITTENFSTAKYDIFSLFNDHWALVTAGNKDSYNTMTIGWGTMGSIWGGPGTCRQVVEVFIRENRKTYETMRSSDYFTVCFFPAEKKQDLMTLGRISGRDVPDKVALTSLTPKFLDNAVGFAEAQLTFVCRKIYTHKMNLNEVPEDVAKRMYIGTDTIHCVFMGQIVDAFGETFE